ncbi:MAG: TRAP transporter substrate-binding protein DctP [Deltaproteobacteria bacterium]|nr:MAG: TRAP transporter substrate-binding protein DctP [Deltaproteobacteria bacterium]
MRRVWNYLITSILGTLIVVGLTLGASVNVVQAADTIELTYGGNWPPSHPFTKATIIWIDKIEKETQGRVKIKPFWASALYKPKDSAMELAKGVADIGDLSGAYAAVGYDFEKSMRMAFWGVKDRYLARKVYMEALDKFPQLKAEFIDAGVKVMAYAGIPPYQLLLTRKPIRKVEDFKGMTFKATGDIGKIPPAFGGEGIVMPMSETYTAMQKNTIDGAFAPFETLKTFRFGEVIKYALELNIASAPAGHWGFCLKSWNKLPKDIQKVFEDNIDWFGEKIEEMVYAGEELGINFAKEHGAEFIKLAPGELDKVYAVVDGIIVEQMADLDKKGLDGTAVYKEMRRLIKQHGR